MSQRGFWSRLSGRQDQSDTPIVMEPVQSQPVVAFQDVLAESVFRSLIENPTEWVLQPRWFASGSFIVQKDGHLAVRPANHGQSAILVGQSAYHDIPYEDAKLLARAVSTWLAWDMKPVPSVS